MGGIGTQHLLIEAGSFGELAHLMSALSVLQHEFQHGAGMCLRMRAAASNLSDQKSQAGVKPRVALLALKVMMRHKKALAIRLIRPEGFSPAGLTTIFTSRSM